MKLHTSPNLDEIRQLLDRQHPRQVGIVGQPPRIVIAELNQRNIEILDLDAMLVHADMESTVTILPRVYCAILRTVVINALHLDLRRSSLISAPASVIAPSMWRPSSRRS